MPIQNAANKKLNEQTGGVPQVGGAMLNWFQPNVFTRITTEDKGFQVVETREEINFIGVVQPLNGRELEMKPEGQRMWEWLTVHAQPTLVLLPDEVIEYLGKKYRVMRQKNYKIYGYVEYHLVEDYTGYPGSGD